MNILVNKFGEDETNTGKANVQAFKYATPSGMMQQCNILSWHPSSMRTTLISPGKCTSQMVKYGDSKIALSLLNQSVLFGTNGWQKGSRSMRIILLLFHGEDQSILSILSSIK